MLIREETRSDYAAIHAVHTAAFPTSAEARLVEQLRKDGDLVISLVAQMDGAIVGHIAFSRMQAPFRALGLAPLAVLPARQRKGIGSTLIRAGLARASSEGWDGIFVLGDPPYYERFGFSVAHAAEFACRYAGPHFMALATGSHSLPKTDGTVAYAAAFAALD